jgi:diadenosine tetraphosphatase ApaH/serine/threonine PP2A family protein phosphatase
MRLALLADVHANLEALTACLAHAEQAGAEGYVFLGDLVGYGADPVAVLDLVAARAARGAIVVRGNHDTAVLDGRAEYMDHAAAEAVAWTRTQIEDRHREFIASLPALRRQEDATFVHASAFHPESWVYVSDPARAAQSLEAAGGAYVFCGHVHEPALYYLVAGHARSFTPVPGVPIPVPRHRRWLAIVGSAGQPRDGRTAACYAMADLAHATLTFFRVPYDFRAAAAKIRAARLPERLARRLEHGK